MNWRLDPFFALHTISAGGACERRKEAYLKNMPIPRWSLRFSPTPGRSTRTLTPTFSSSSRGPMPETLRICSLSLAAKLETKIEPHAPEEKR